MQEGRFTVCAEFCSGIAENWLLDVKQSGTGDALVVNNSAVNNQLSFHSMEDLRQLQCISPHSGSITDFHFTAEFPQVLVSCSLDGSLRCWDTRTRAAGLVVQGGGTSLHSCCTAGWAVCASEQELVWMWDMRRLPGAQPSRVCLDWLHSDIVSRVRHYPRADKLLTAGTDALINVVDHTLGDSDESLLITVNVDSSISCIGQHGDLTWCLTDTNDLSVWDLHSGVRHLSRSFPELAGAAGSASLHFLISCHSAQQLLLCAGGNFEGDVGFLEINAAGEARLNHVLSGSHTASVRGLCLLEGAVFTCGEDGRLCAWRRDSVQQPASLQPGPRRRAREKTMLLF